jgi:hypothetical protein
MRKLIVMELCMYIMPPGVILPTYSINPCRQQYQHCSLSDSRDNNLNILLLYMKYIYEVSGMCRVNTFRPEPSYCHVACVTIDGVWIDE